MEGGACRGELNFSGDYRLYFNANETFRSTLLGISTCLRRDCEGALPRPIGSAEGVPPIFHFQLGLTLISMGYASFILLP